MLANFFISCYNKIMANIGNERLTDEQQRLVEDNMGLVYKIAHDRGMCSEDDIQNGMLGLINAVRFYSPEFGCTLSTYAGSYIWAALSGSYSEKKNRKKDCQTDSLDDPNFNTQIPSVDSECFAFYETNVHPLANKIVKMIMDGFSKYETRTLFNLELDEINAILKDVGRSLYGNRGNKKKG